MLHKKDRYQETDCKNMLLVLEQLLKILRTVAASFMYILWTLRMHLEVYHMICELRDAGYPKWLCSLTKEIYMGSSFRIRTKNGLSGVVMHRKGIIQGDPWSVILFEQGIDRWLRGVQSLATEETNPTGFGYVDDVNMRSKNKKIRDKILSRTADSLDFTGMQVKHRKCAILQGKRSGVNWKELNNRKVAKGGFPLFAETTRSKLASTRWLAEQFPVIV